MKALRQLWWKKCPQGVKESLPVALTLQIAQVWGSSGFGFSFRGLPLGLLTGGS